MSIKQDYLYILYFVDTPICIDTSYSSLFELSLKMKNDLDNIHQEYEKRTFEVINSGIYPLNDLGCDAPCYSRVLCNKFNEIKSEIWSNKEYEYLLFYGLNNFNYYKGASWCTFKITKALKVVSMEGI